MKTKRLILALIAGLALSSAAQAVLVDNGGGLIYDSTDNITWLQDANLPASNNFGVSGVNADGSLQTWFVAVDLIMAMNSADYLGHSDWRLPNMNDKGAPGCANITANGSDDCGYNNSNNNGELASLFYNEMNGKADYSSAGAAQSSSFSTGPFMNIQTGQTAAYWYGTTLATDSSGAWIFDFSGGGQIYFGKTTGGFSFWPVLPGNVSPAAAVPEPEAWLLMLAGLGLVGSAVARRRHG